MLSFIELSNYKEKLPIAPTKISGLRFIYSECEPPEELLFENMAYIYGYTELVCLWTMIWPILDIPSDMVLKPHLWMQKYFSINRIIGIDIISFFSYDDNM